MTPEARRDAIRALLASHPDVMVSGAGHSGYIERFRTTRGANIGLETRGSAHQNLFVEAKAIRAALFADIHFDRYFAIDYPKSRPNSNLFHRDAFGDTDIVRFMITDLWQAVRVITEVAGGCCR